jgi:hypothetical protein
MKKYIKGYRNYLIYSNGVIEKCSNWARRGGKNISPVKTKKGYLRVSLMNKDGKKSFMVHRIVAEHFVKGKTKENKFVNHKDCNKLNNNASNLEWCSHSFNMRHAYKNGLLQNRRRFTDEQIVDIRKSVLSQRKLGKKYGVSGSAIKKIKDYKMYVSKITN